MLSSLPLLFLPCLTYVVDVGVLQIFLPSPATERDLKLKLAQENLNLRRDFAEKDDVLDEVIRKNSELAQENQDLTEEINESVEIAKEKARLVLELAQEN